MKDYSPDTGLEKARQNYRIEDPYNYVIIYKIGEQDNPKDPVCKGILGKKNNS